MNKQGFISTLKLGDKGREQEKLLREEGVQVIKGCILMSVFGVPQQELFMNYSAQQASS